MLDKQSGVSQHNVRVSETPGGFGVSAIYGDGKVFGDRGFDDTSGISRMFHTCKYARGEADLLTYCPKVSAGERNSGLGKERCKHPTLKPISLTTKIMTLFKLPIEGQKVYIPFAGTFSEAIGAFKAGIKEKNIHGCEISEEYCKIGQARFDYWKRKREPQKARKPRDKSQLTLNQN